MKKNNVGYIADSLSKIKKSDDHEFFAKEVTRLLKLEKKFSENILSKLSAFENISNKIVEGFSALDKIMILYSDPIFKALIPFSERGWYVSPMSIRSHKMEKLSSILINNNFSEFEDLIMTDSDKIVNQIIADAIILYPDRKNILNEIKSCYENQFYSAVINLSYSQVDGMCNETLGYGFFDKDKKSKTDKKILKIYNEFSKIDYRLAQIIKEQLGYKKNEITIYSDEFKDENPDIVFKSINRHLILHGHSYTYGNKINAMRAILLIDFINYFKENI